MSSGAGSEWVPITQLARLEGPGTWTCEKKGVQYHRSEPLQDPDWGLAVCGERFRDGVVRVVLRFEGPNGPMKGDRQGDSAGIVLGYSPKSENYVIAGLGGFNYAYAVWEHASRIGWGRPKGQGTVQDLNYNEDYQLEVTLSGERLSLIVNHILMVDHMLPAGLPGDQLGLFVHSNSRRLSAVLVKDFEVQHMRERPMSPPVEIQESLARFKVDYPDAAHVAFVMMRFGPSPAHDRILGGIKTSLTQYGLVGLRADDKQYHDDILWNIITYIYGCGFGVAVFERLLDDDFNPNVSLEVGYMMALRKEVCLLKDQTLPKLPTDLVGRLYRSFNTQDPVKTIIPQLESWLKDKGIVPV